MRQPPLDPEAADEAPVSEFLTPYDHAHAITYLRLLDAERDGADWTEAARVILRIDPYCEQARASRSWESHLSRARWMTEHGHQHLVRRAQLH